MNDRDQRRADRINRSSIFMQQNRGEFANGSKALEYADSLASTSNKLNDARSKQQMSAPVSKESLLDALRLDVQNISGFAREFDVIEPGFAKSFPALESNNEQAVISRADLYLSQLVENAGDSVAVKASKTALRAKFTSHEFPADFAENLASDRETIDSANKDIEAGREISGGSTAEISRLVREGTDFCNLLDRMMRVKYAQNVEKLRAWEIANHLERSPRRNAKAAASRGAIHALIFLSRGSRGSKVISPAHALRYGRATSLPKHRRVSDDVYQQQLSGDRVALVESDWLAG